MVRLEAKARLFEVAGATHPSFSRAFELLNKTNQFNTTGKRWTPAEIQEFLSGGGRIFAFEVADKYTSYGLVGVILLPAPSRIEQFVMSCRVMGMGVETSMLSTLGRKLAQDGAARLSGAIVETDANRPARDLFTRFGMTLSGQGAFSLDLRDVPPPAAHLSIATD